MNSSENELVGNNNNNNNKLLVIKAKPMLNHSFWNLYHFTFWPANEKRVIKNDIFDIH